MSSLIMGESHKIELLLCRHSLELLVDASLGTMLSVITALARILILSIRRLLLLAICSCQVIVSAFARSDLSHFAHKSAPDSKDYLDRLYKSLTYCTSNAKFLVGNQFRLTTF